MEGKKIILSLFGVCALAVPVILLIVFSSKSQSQPQVPGGDRTISTEKVQNVVSKIPTPSPISLPSPTPASPSATVSGGEESEEPQ